MNAPHVSLDEFGAVGEVSTIIVTGCLCRPQVSAGHSSVSVRGGSLIYTAAARSAIGMFPALLPCARLISLWTDAALSGYVGGAPVCSVLIIFLYAQDIEAISATRQRKCLMNVI